MVINMIYLIFALLYLIRILEPFNCPHFIKLQIKIVTHIVSMGNELICIVDCFKNVSALLRTFYNIH